MLENYSPDQIAAFWTGVGALAAVAASAVAVVTLIALRRDSTDRTRPVFSAELRPVLLVVSPPRRALVLANTGATSARNVQVDFDPPLPDTNPAGDGPQGAGMWTYSIKRRYERPIATWPVGLELSNLYFVGTEDDAAGTWVNVEPLPDTFTVSISYQDLRGRKYTDVYELDDTIWVDETFSGPSGSTERDVRMRTVRALETIARGVGRH